LSHHYFSPCFTIIFHHDWLVVSTYPSEKMMEFVSWDDELFPTEWKVIKFMFQSTNQKKSPVLEDRFVDFVAHCLGFRHAITCLGDLALGKLPQEKRVGFLP